MAGWTRGWMAKVLQGWGGHQALGGLALTTTHRRPVRDADGRPPHWIENRVTLLPDTLAVDVFMRVPTRRQGIYGAPVAATPAAAIMERS